MGKNGSAAPARTGGTTRKLGAPAAGDQQSAKGNPNGVELQQPLGSGGQQVLQEVLQKALDTSRQQGQPEAPGAGDQSQNDEAGESGASAGNMIAASPPSIYGLEVTSSQAGFRRAGRAWSTTPTVIRLSELNEEQARQIKDEPMLSAKLVLLPAEEA